MKYEKFLTIGSVVRLQGGEKRVMIIGYLPMPDESEKAEMYDYIGCVFPEGMIELDEILVFNHYQIETVYALGYHDNEVDEFKKDLVAIEKEILTQGIQNFKQNNDAKPAAPLAQESQEVQAEPELPMQSQQTEPAEVFPSESAEPELPLQPQQPVQSSQFIQPQQPVQPEAPNQNANNDFKIEEV